MKTSYLALAAPILAALFTPALAMPAQSYPGCEAATNAAAIGDQTALKNAIAACEYLGFPRRYVGRLVLTFILRRRSRQYWLFWIQLFSPYNWG